MYKQILVGSQAIKTHFPDFYRETNDYDFWRIGGGDYRKSKGDLVLNPEDFTVSKNPDQIEIKDVSRYEGLSYFVEKCQDLPSPTDLYTLKLSHCFWNIHWQKTMRDILFFQENNIQYDSDLFKLLYKDWEIIHGKKPAYLDMDNDEFFTESVKRKYIHDDIHAAIAYYDKPMYSVLKTDSSKALISRKMFESLSHEDKIKTCREEIYVTALERFLVPNKFVYSTLVAYRGALKRLVTSMTKGWFPLFIVLNYKELKNPDLDYREKFLERIDNVRECRAVS